MNPGEQQGAAADDLHAAGEHGAVRPAGGHRHLETHHPRYGLQRGGPGVLPLVSFSPWSGVFCLVYSREGGPPGDGGGGGRCCFSSRRASPHASCLALDTPEQACRRLASMLLLEKGLTRRACSIPWREIRGRLLFVCLRLKPEVVHRQLDSTSMSVSMSIAVLPQTKCKEALHGYTHTSTLHYCGGLGQ